MWAVEKDPALRSDFCNLTMLEHRPSDERLRATLERALAAIPRLGQRVIGAPLRIVPPEFADDPTLDLDGARSCRRGARRRAMNARCSILCGRSPSSRSTGRGRCGSSRSSRDSRRPRRAVAEGAPHDHRRRRRLRLSLAFVDFEPDPEPQTPTTHRRRGAADSPRHTARATRSAVADATTRNLGLRARRASAHAGRLIVAPGRAPALAAAKQLRLRRARCSARRSSPIRRAPT